MALQAHRRRVEAGRSSAGFAGSMVRTDLRWHPPTIVGIPVSKYLLVDGLDGFNFIAYTSSKSMNHIILWVDIQL